MDYAALCARNAARTGVIEDPRSNDARGKRMLKVLAWIVGILLLIGILVVVGIFDLIF